MTSEAESDLAKNFRASYYESLGFRGGEKSLSHLEGLLKAEILGTTADWSTVRTSVFVFILPQTLIS